MLKTQPSTIHLARFEIASELARALLFSQLLAVGWWLAALWLRSSNTIPVWFDQEATFTQSLAHLANPYALPRFIYPPWSALLLAPFGLPSLSIAVLVQLCLYFAILTGVIFKFGGSPKTVLVVLTSYIALDSALELNIDWIVCLGILLPPLWSGPFLLVKPQDAPGYLLSFKRRDLVRAIIVVLALLLVSLVLWPSWPINALHSANTISPLWGQEYNINIAPLSRLPIPIALIIGALLAWRAFRRRDPALGILAGLFFVPYIALYGLLLPLAMVAVRFFRLALIINLVMWIVYGGVLAHFLFHII